MCGIVGAVAGRNVVPILLEGLKRLEYRGYDSAGVAVLHDGLRRLRATGRVAELERQIESNGLSGATGIAHTRWATHGAPSERNAHPHVSGGICVVHNGIIENHDALRTVLADAGFRTASTIEVEQAYSSGSIDHVERRVLHARNWGGMVGGWALGIPSGHVGWSLGAACGTAICPGPGTVIGGVIGGLVGGAAGYIAGEEIVGRVAGFVARELGQPTAGVVPPG